MVLHANARVDVLVVELGGDDDKDPIDSRARGMSMHHTTARFYTLYWVPTFVNPLTRSGLRTRACLGGFRKTSRRRPAHVCRDSIRVYRRVDDDLFRFDNPAVADRFMREITERNPRGVPRSFLLPLTFRTLEDIVRAFVLYIVQPAAYQRPPPAESTPTPKSSRVCGHLHNTSHKLSMASPSCLWRRPWRPLSEPEPEPDAGTSGDPRGMSCPQIRM